MLEKNRDASNFAIRKLEAGRENGVDWYKDMECKEAVPNEDDIKEILSLIELGQKKIHFRVCKVLIMLSKEFS